MTTPKKPEADTILLVPQGASDEAAEAASQPLSIAQLASPAAEEALARALADPHLVVMPPAGGFEFATERSSGAMPTGGHEQLGDEKTDDGAGGHGAVQTAPVDGVLDGAGEPEPAATTSIASDSGYETPSILKECIVPLTPMPAGEFVPAQASLPISQMLGGGDDPNSGNVLAPPPDPASGPDNASSGGSETAHGEKLTKSVMASSNGSETNGAGNGHAVGVEMTPKGVDATKQPRATKRSAKPKPLMQQLPSYVGKAPMPYSANELHKLVCPEIIEVDFTSNSECTDSIFCRASRYYPDSMTRKVEWAIRAGVAATVAGAMVLYGPLNDTRIAPITSLVLLQSTEVTLGRTVKNVSGILSGAVLGVVFPYLLLPTGLLDTSNSGREAVSILAVFALTMLATYFFTNIESMKNFMAINALLLLLSVVGDDAAENDPYVYPMRYVLGTTIGAAICVFVNLLPFPRLARVELNFRIRLGYQQALNTFNILVYSFVTSEELQSRMLSSRVSTRLRKLGQNLAALSDLLPDLWWEGCVGKELQLATARTEQLSQLMEALRGMEETVARGEARNFTAAQARFVEFIQSPLAVVTARAEQLMRYEVMGEVAGDSATNDDKGGDLYLDDAPMRAAAAASDGVSDYTWEELIQKPMGALWTAYRNARYELLYSEKSNDPATRWTPEEHLLSDFFVFSLSEFTTALRTSPRAVVEHALEEAKKEKARVKEAAKQSYSNAGSLRARIRLRLASAFSRLKISIAAKVKAILELDRSKLRLSLRHSVALTSVTLLNIVTTFATPTLIFAVSFLINDRLGGAFMTAVQRFVGVSIGVLLGFLAVVSVSGYTGFLLLFAFVWIAACTFSRADGRWDNALTIAAGTSVLIMFPGVEQDVGQTASAAQTRTLMTFLAAAVSLVASLGIAPKKSSTCVADRFGDFLSRSKEQLDTCFALYIDRCVVDPNAAAHKDDSKRSDLGDRRASSEISIAPSERPSSRASSTAAIPAGAATPGGDGGGAAGIGRRARRAARFMLRQQTTRYISRRNLLEMDNATRYLVSDELLDSTHELLKTMRSFMTEQQKFMTEAREEPQFGAAPFPIASYEQIASSQRVIVRFLGLLVAALRNVDTELLPVQVQFMRISFERIKSNIVGALDDLAKVIQSKSELEASNFEEVLEGSCVRLEKSMQILDTKFKDYALYISDVIRQHVAQSRFDADVTYTHYRMLWGLNAFVFSTRTILRHIVKIEHLVVDMMHLTLDHARTS